MRWVASADGSVLTAWGPAVQANHLALLASMRAAVAAVERDAGAVGVLVSNADYSQPGAVETVPLELARRQFETNLFGPVRLTQLVLPGMRRQGWVPHGGPTYQ